MHMWTQVRYNESQIMIYNNSLHSEQTLRLNEKMNEEGKKYSIPSTTLTDKNCYNAVP